MYIEHKVGDGDLKPAGDMVIVKIPNNEKTTSSGIIVQSEEKEMNRGIVVASQVKGYKCGQRIYYKYGRTIKCETEDPAVDYVVVEKDNIWCTDLKYSKE